MSMLQQAIADLQASVQSALLPDHPWLAGIAGRFISFFDVSFLDTGGRYFWPTGLAAMAVLAIGFALRPDWRARWGGAGFLRFCFPAGYFSHPSTWTDLKINLANYMVLPLVNIAWRFNGAWFAVAIAGGLTALFGPAAHPLEWNGWTLVAFTLAFAVFDDFGYWVWHYLAHKVPALWAFHKVHHSAEILTPLVAGRVHPLEAVLLPVFRAAASGLVAGPALYVFVAEGQVLTVFGMSVVAMVFAAAGNQLFHAHVPISWGHRLNHVFVSPATHQIHHSIERRHWDKNMGALLSVWDWMFGTLYLPDSHQKLVYGVAPDVVQPHPGLLAAWMRPFWDAIPGRARALAVPPSRVFTLRRRQKGTP